MQLNFLTVMAYLIVIITVMTMVFGILAYFIYKMREAKRQKQQKLINENEKKEFDAKDKYLFFEFKEIIV